MPCTPHRLPLRLPLHTSKIGIDAVRGIMSTPTRCPEEHQLARHLRLPFTGPRRVSTPLRRGGNGEEVQTRGVCMMDQILLRRSDEHTPTVEAKRIPYHLFDACAAEASDIVPPAFSRVHRITKRSSTTTTKRSTKKASHYAATTEQERFPGAAAPGPPLFPGAAAPGPPLLSHGMWRPREDPARLNPWTSSKSIGERKRYNPRNFVLMSARRSER